MSFGKIRMTGDEFGVMNNKPKTIPHPEPLSQAERGGIPLRTMNTGKLPEASFEDRQDD